MKKELFVFLQLNPLYDINFEFQGFNYYKSKLLRCCMYGMVWYGLMTSHLKGK